MTIQSRPSQPHRRVSILPMLHGLRVFAVLSVAVLSVLSVAACSGQSQDTPAATATPPAATTPSTPPALTPPANDAPIPPTTSPYDALPEAVRTTMDKPFTGDFDAMVERRAIRAAVTFNRTHYFVDQGQERGLTFEALKAFENDLNADLKTGNLKVHIVIVPMTRDQLYPALAGGQVDVVAAMVTVRPELEKLAAFSTPTRTNVSQLSSPGRGRQRLPPSMISPARKRHERAI